MANAIIALVVPGTDNTTGPATDVSTLAGTVSVEISGAYQGSYTVLGSQDGVLFVPLLIFDSGAGVQAFKQTITIPLHYMRVKRNATAIASMSVAGETSTSNQFIALAPVPANAGVGPQPSVDVWTIVPTTGYDNGFAALGAGDFVGTIALEGSLDGIQFSPLGAFSASPRDPNAPSPVFSPIVVANTVRFVRLNVMPGTSLAGPLLVTIGGNQIAASGAPFPGFGGAPPPVAAASAAGVAATASRSDHTHQGVTSANGLFGTLTYESLDGSIGITEPDSSHINFVLASLGDFGTLAKIYAFGLADDAPVDNMFAMPTGNMYFQGLQGVNQYDFGFFGTNGTGQSATAVHNFVRLWQASNAIGLRRFNQYSLNDPTWDGTVTDLDDVSWLVEDASFGSSATDVTTSQVILGRRVYEFLGLQPFAYGTGNTTLKGLVWELQLWNQDEGLTEIQRINSYGQQILSMYPHGHGITPAFSGNLNFPNFVPAAGDGSGFYIAEGAPTFALYKPKGAFTAIMNGPFGAGTEWYSSIWAYPGSPPSPDEFTITEVARFFGTVGEKILIGGIQLPNTVSGTFAVSDATTLRMIWDDTLKNIMVSWDTNPYVPLVTQFFELNLSFGVGGPSPGGGSGGHSTVPGSGTSFWLLPFTITDYMFVPGSDTTEYEWECPIPGTSAELVVNSLIFSGSLGPSLTAIMTINGVQSASVGVVWSATGIFSITAAQAVSAGDKIGIKITGGGSSVTAVFTARLRVLP